jgi:very-short-patch-repair endonuclease
LINTSGVSSNGRSQHFTADDLSRFHPAVQKALRKLQLLHDGISIEPIMRKIAHWISPLDQVFYVTSLSLKISKRINPKIHIEDQYHIASGGKKYFVDFRFRLIDDRYPQLDPFIAFVECDSRAFHDRTQEDVTKDRQRWRELQRQGGKVYPFSGKELLKNPERCVIEVVKDLQRDMLARHETLMEVFL